MNETDWRLRGEWRGAMAAVVLNVLGMPISMALGRAIPGMPLWPNFMSITVGILLAGILLVRRRTPTPLVVDGVFLLNVAVVVTALWLTNSVYAASGRLWVPFQANKLGMMALVLLAPARLWVGLLSIAAHAGAAVAQLFTFDDAVRASLAIGEPEATLAFAVFATILLVYRHRRNALEREEIRSQTERAGMVSFARAVLAIRDLSNTPLQTIQFAAAAARIRYPDDLLWDRIDRAMAELHARDGRLLEYEHALAWGPKEESFDPADILSPPSRAGARTRSARRR